MTGMICKFVIVGACLCATCNIFAQNARYDSLRTAIVSFLIVSENRDFTDRGADNILLIRDAVSMYQIGDNRDYQWTDYQMGSELKNGIYSIFPMSSFNEYTYNHLLLVSNNEFAIINMRDSFRTNLALLTDFLKNNPVFTKENSLLYIQEFIRISEANTDNGSG